jgi:hypothetical protein
MYLGEKSLATCINYCDTAITVSYKYSFCRIAQVRSQWVTKYITCTEEIHFFFWKTISFLLSQIDQHHACILYSGALTPQPYTVHVNTHVLLQSALISYLSVQTRGQKGQTRKLSLLQHTRKKKGSLWLHAWCHRPAFSRAPSELIT